MPFPVLPVLTGILIFLIYRWIQDRMARKVQSNPPCKPNEHQWRSIAAPYARQCRKCGVAAFREDGDGNFPDGLREYFEYIENLKKERML